MSSPGGVGFGVGSCCGTVDVSPACVKQIRIAAFFEKSNPPTITDLLNDTFSIVRQDAEPPLVVADEVGVMVFDTEIAYGFVAVGFTIEAGQLW